MTWTQGIPSSASSPAQDQPKMLDNFTNIFNTQNVDHFFADGSGNEGKHRFVEMPNSTYQVPPGQVGNSSSVFAQAGVANTGVPQAIYKNASGLFPMSAVRAFGTFNGTGGAAIVPQNQFNVSGNIAHTGVGTYAITLVANTVTTTNYGVVVSCGESATGVQLVCNYKLLAFPTFRILTFKDNSGGFATVDAVNVSFLVFQI